MNEVDAYKIFRRKVIFKYDRCDRIENIVGVGNPDVNYCIDGVEGWIELKCPKEPKRETTPLFGSNHKLSIDQMNWFLRQKNSLGVGFVLIVTDKSHWILIDGCKYGDSINLLTKQQLIEISHIAFKENYERGFGDMRKILKLAIGNNNGI